MVERIPDNRDGFTLVEMMVTLAIIAFLGLTAVPLTQRLIHSADVENADTQLMQAIAAAKSLAMRNPGKFTGEAAAALVDHDEETRTVSVSVPNENVANWQAVLPSGIEITPRPDSGIPPEELFPLRLDNRGRPINDFEYRISKGNEHQDSSPFRNDQFDGG
jgi:prepilin-type N-terminal cleavage/methylation domain-containing protein